MTAIARPRRLFSAQPDDIGLYRGENEHDACGVAMVATMRGSAGHDIIEHALTALRNLDHRGATGADPLVGDGAGILSQVPDAFLREVVDFTLPSAGAYAVGLAFLPMDEAERAATVEAVERIAAEESLTVLGWRDVPVAADIIGEVARDCMPHFAQLFVSVGGAAGGPTSASTGSPSVCASAPSSRPTSTSPRCRRAPSSTRGC